jgi:dihydroorotase-like cyclic amidohydrolase
MSVLVKGGLIFTSTGCYIADVFAQGDKIKAIGTGQTKRRLKL